MYLLWELQGYCSGAGFCGSGCTSRKQNRHRRRSCSPTEHSGSPFWRRTGSRNAAVLPQKRCSCLPLPMIPTAAIWLSSRHRGCLWRHIWGKPPPDTLTHRTAPDRVPCTQSCFLVKIRFCWERSNTTAPHRNSSPRPFHRIITCQIRAADCRSGAAALPCHWQR